MLEDFQTRGIYLTEEEYRTGLRSLFSEEYQDLSDEQLEDILYDRIAQMSPAEAEGFFSSVGNFFKDKVAPVAVAALPAAATIAGTVFGGPAGAAIGGVAGKFAADAISQQAKIKPNTFVSTAGQAATSIASGNYQAAIPSVINLGRSAGNSISPGAGNKFANVAANIAQAGTAIAGGKYGAAVPGIVNVTQNPQAATQLLSFLKSTPFLQTLLSSIATGNHSTGLQLLKEDGSATTTSYVEMLEALKHLTENAIAEADNAGVTSSLSFESEAEDNYIESLIEDVNQYENTLLPNYDTLTY